MKLSIMRFMTTVQTLGRDRVNTLSTSSNRLAFILLLLTTVPGTAIQNGVQTTQGQFGSVFYFQTRPYNNFPGDVVPCVGTLIHKSLLLTSAQCLKTRNQLPNPVPFFPIPTVVPVNKIEVIPYLGVNANGLPRFGFALPVSRVYFPNKYIDYSHSNYQFLDDNGIFQNGPSFSPSSLSSEHSDGDGGTFSDLALIQFASNVLIVTEPTLINMGDPNATFIPSDNKLTVVGFGENATGSGLGIQRSGVVKFTQYLEGIGISGYPQGGFTSASQLEFPLPGMPGITGLVPNEGFRVDALENQTSQLACFGDRGSPAIGNFGGTPILMGVNVISGSLVTDPNPGCSTTFSTAYTSMAAPSSLEFLRSSIASAGIIPPNRAPSNLTVAVSQTAQSFTLNWTNNASTNVSSVDNKQAYTEIWRKTSTTPFQLVSMVGKTSAHILINTYTDSAVARNSIYTYKVRTANIAGAEKERFSNTIETSFPVAAPTAPTAVQTSGTDEVVLSWVAPSANITHFHIERQLGSGGFSFLREVVSSVTSITDPIGSLGGTYTYRIKSKNGEVASPASTNAVVNFVAAPEDLGHTTSANRNLTLSWKHDGNSLTGFKLERKLSTAPEFSELTPAPSAAARVFVDTAVDENMTYIYRITAKNNNILSAVSSEYQLTVVFPPVPPTAANAVSTTLEGTLTNVAVSWEFPQRSKVNGFKIFRSTPGVDYTEIQSVSAETRSFEDTDVTYAQTYNYKIKAFVNAVPLALESEFSNKATVITPQLQRTRPQRRVRPVSSPTAPTQPGTTRGSQTPASAPTPPMNPVSNRGKK